MKPKSELYFDKYKLLCSRHAYEGLDEIDRRFSKDKPWLDGGDTANRHCVYILGRANLHRNMLKNTSVPLLKNWAITSLDHLECPESKGNYRRHPDELFWYSKDDIMSRDQTIPVLLLMASFELRQKLKNHFKAHLKRLLLFATNTKENGATLLNHGDFKKFDKKGKRVLRDYTSKLPDFTGPSIWSIYIRAFETKWLYWLLPILDLELLFNAALKNTANKKDNDVINHIVLSIYAADHNPSFVIRYMNNRINKAKPLHRKLVNFYHGETMPYFIADTYRQLCWYYFSE